LIAADPIHGIREALRTADTGITGGSKIAIASKPGCYKSINWSG
jgi:hypothetical protein